MSYLLLLGAGAIGAAYYAGKRKERKNIPTRAKIIAGETPDLMLQYKDGSTQTFKLDGDEGDLEFRVSE